MVLGGFNPNGFTVGYYICHLISRLCAYIFFRKVHQVGFERIPKTGPLIICGTHNN